MTTKRFETLDGINSDGAVEIANTLTISSNVIVDTTTFVVDAVLNRVGVNKVPTQGSLDVSGAVYATELHGNGAGITSLNFLTPTANVTYSDGRFTIGSNATVVFTSNSILQLSDNRPLNFGTGATVTALGNNSGLFVNGSNVAFDSNVLYIDTLNNRVGVNKSTPTVALDVVGSITATGDINSLSDEKFKTDIRTIENALDIVKSLRGVRYIKDDKESIGLIAQEVNKVVPEVVTENEEFFAISYGNLIGLLVEAIKELSDKIDK